ncbi:unnamed protein product [Timema podura]|uniref:Uncharacterized protein n=1 Tax=Timema podura TaxID=61482 RepID=A0ABN7P1I4_TIMPD|nr:unnamed protein product [Timema podura]
MAEWSVHVPRNLKYNTVLIVTYLGNMDDEPSPNGTLFLNKPKKNKHKRSEDVDSSLSTSMNDDPSFSKASVHRKPVFGKTLSRRTNLPHSDDSQESDDSSSSICSLERRRLKNIQENKEFLKSLGITQMVEDISNRLEEKKYAEKKKRANRAKRPKVDVQNKDVSTMCGFHPWIQGHVRDALTSFVTIWTDLHLIT